MRNIGINRGLLLGLSLLALNSSPGQTNLESSIQTGSVVLVQEYNKPNTSFTRAPYKKLLTLINGGREYYFFYDLYDEKTKSAIISVEYNERVKRISLKEGEEIKVHGLRFVFNVITPDYIEGMRTPE
jgi:hypothetical protein